MKKIIVIAILFCSFSALAQKTTPGNYTYIAQKYEWDDGIFKGLGIPSGSGPAAFRTGQVVRAGAVYYDSIGIDSGLYVYSGLAWRLQGGGEVPGIDTVLAIGDTSIGRNITMTDNAGKLWFQVHVANKTVGAGDLNNFYDNTQWNVNDATKQINAVAKNGLVLSLDPSVNTLNTIRAQSTQSVDDSLYLPNTGNTSDTLATLENVRTGGGSQTLQQVFNTEVGGSVLTKSDTINAGSNTLNIIGDGSVVNFAGSLRAKPSYTSNWVASLGYVGNGVSAYGALSFRENSTGGGDVVTLSPPVNVTTSYNIYLPEGNNDDTLATKAYARSVGGGVGNLLVDSIGIAGTDLVVPRNDTLYHRLLKGSTHVGVDTVVSTGEARVTLLSIPVSYVIAASDETTDITTGTAKVTFRMPHAMTVTDVRASVNTVSSSGLPTIDINEAGTTILSTKITIDVSEKSSTTAATPPVISDSALADDAEITIDIDVSGTGAKGLKIIITGTRTI